MTEVVLHLCLKFKNSWYDKDLTESVGKVLVLVYPVGICSNG